MISKPNKLSLIEKLPNLSKRKLTALEAIEVVKVLKDLQGQLKIDNIIIMIK